MSSRCSVRDSDRTQVYEAEDLSAERTVLVEPMPMERLNALACDVVGSSWWQQNFDPQPVTVQQNRSQRLSSFSPATRTIGLSPNGMDLNTLCHELAHAAHSDAAVGGASHGPIFRLLHCRVRKLVLGPEAAADLADVYRQFGLGICADRWGLPVGQRPLLGADRYAAVRIVGRPDPRPISARDTGPIAL